MREGNLSPYLFKVAVVFELPFESQNFACVPGARNPGGAPNF